MTEAELQAEIIRRVAKSWDEHKAPILLANLGAQNDNEISNEVKRIGWQLRQYIESKLGTQIRILRHSKFASLLGALPRVPETDVIVDIDSILEWAVRSQKQPPKPRYSREFWYAFTSPLDPDKKRYVSIGPPLAISDVLGTDPVPNGGLEISSESILPPEQVKNVLRIHETIDAWLTKNGHSASEFQQTRIDQRVSTATRQRELTTLLALLLDTLAEEQLRRVSLPLDVVLKLSDRKIS